MSVPAILVLAGRRASASDPLANAAGTTHKCMVPVGGRAMIGRVLDIAAAADPEAPLYISIEDFSVIEAEPSVARLHAEGRLLPIASRDDLVDSIFAAGAVTGFPLIITTADNVLLTPAALRELTERGSGGGTDAIVVLAEREDIVAAHPDGQRRFYEFKDKAISNCNLFWLGSEHALASTESFRGGGQFAKHPARLVKAFGLLNLIRFRFRLATLDQTFTHLSRRFGVRIAPMLVKDGRLAIDVDNERTHRVAEEILERETIS